MIPATGYWLLRADWHRRLEGGTGTLQSYTALQATKGPSVTGYGARMLRKVCTGLLKDVQEFGWVAVEMGRAGRTEQEGCKMEPSPITAQLWGAAAAVSAERSSRRMQWRRSGDGP